MAYLVSGSLMTPFLHVSYNSNVTNTVGQVGGDIEGDIDIAILVITSQWTQSIWYHLICMHKAQTNGFPHESDKNPQKNYIKIFVLRMHILQRIIRSNHEHKHTCQDMTWMWQTSTNHYIRSFIILKKLLPKPCAQPYVSGLGMNLTNVDKPLHQKVRPLDKIFAQTMSTNIHVRQTMLVNALSHWILLQSHY